MAMMQGEIHAVEHHLEHELKFATDEIKRGEHKLQQQVAKMERTLKRLVKRLEAQTGQKLELLNGELVEARSGGSVLWWLLAAIILFMVGSVAMGTRKYQQLTKRNFL